MVQEGLTVGQSLGMTLVTYSGSAQLAVLPLIAGAAPVWIVFATALVVNLRFVIYSLALRPLFADAPVRLRLALGYLTGDVTFVKVMGLLEEQRTVAHPIAYFTGSALTSWAFWQLGSIAGLLGADRIPADSGLDLAGTLALITLVVPLCTRLPALGGVLVAAATSVVGAGLPFKLGLLTGVLAGSVVAVMLEGRLARRRGQAP
jgi:predicted branched-subunit amino acid permease